MEMLQYEIKAHTSINVFILPRGNQLHKSNTWNRY